MRKLNLFSGYPSARSFEGMAEGRAAPLSPSRPAASSDASDRGLTPGQQLALLSVRRSALSREVVAKLKVSTVRASQKDYATIIAKGLAIRHGSRKFLIVTYQGKVAADAIAQAAAKDLEIHFFFTGHSRLSNWIKCACGWSHCYTAAHHHVARCNAEWMGKHLREVGAAKASVIAGGVPGVGVEDQPQAAAPIAC